MLKALNEYLTAVPRRTNDLQAFKKIAGGDANVVIRLANAMWYRGYVLVPLTDEYRDCFLTSKGSLG